MQRHVPEWRSSHTMDLLQELLDVSTLGPASVARRVGLSTSELHSLRHLMHSPMGPVELARTLGVTSAAASGIVDRLVAHGYAERRPHRADGRRTEVVITDVGQSEIFTHLAPMFRGLQEIDAGLSEAERAAVERFLLSAIDAIKRLS